jgi:hypothetical protein
LKPFDFQLAYVGGNLLRARRIGLAAIRQAREMYHSVAADVLDTQSLPVTHYPVNIAHYPSHLRHMMVDGGIQRRRRGSRVTL